MKDRIVVKNFGVLKDIDIAINDFNIIIGTQAQGKSLLAKLIYFFNSLKDRILPHLLIEKLSQTSFIKSLEQDFFKIFPPYILEQYSNFSIKYYFEEYDEPFVIEGNVNRAQEDNEDISLKIQIPSKLFSLILSVKPVKHLLSFATEYTELSTKLNSTLKLPNKAVYIPSGRSFFNFLQGHIFRLIQSDIKFDYLISMFGAFYEYIKPTVYEYLSLRPKKQKIYSLVKEILKGEYKYISNLDEEYLKTSDGKLIRLNDASAGQQEVVPIILSVVSQVTSNYEEGDVFFILEKPETQLYPKTQKQVLEFLVSSYNLSKKNLKFFITTHSPYILTSLNNLVKAYNCFLETPEKEKELNKLIDRSKWISFDNINVYHFYNGKCHNILNTEQRLIDINAIDKISNDIKENFDNLSEK